jgi:hypothetical protein
LGHRAISIPSFTALQMIDDAPQSNWPPIGTENPIPEEMDHREIAVSMPVVDEVQFLFASEPRKPLKPRSLCVIFLVEKDVRVKRRRTCDHLNYEEINRQYEISKCSYETHRNEEEWRIVAFVTEVRPWDKMIFGIVGVMEFDVVAEELTAYWTMAELVMHQRLRKWHDQVRSDGGHEK